MAPQTTTLTTSYTSPTNAPFAIAESIPAPPPTASLDAASKSKYLAALRASVASAQDKINQELTARMKEDKKREEAAGLKHPVDDEKEEENYGEEVQGEED
ncbi:hypothetical protein BBK36DRAFT_1163635 [Trichoderma citrinoviride]|uniref:EKC/KEOPS complex subunit GON7 n=1 Tax=Trichoderma citrinoviride TaxID=58853 RepID=A0A2T4AXI3_9HYPO|nr:hypothetical protein BBK36DRAFT_1163635 [Trichoderma citrinoviride]PTB61790.1 hypothetical protein BBK36DRAFT_1163635 [Trichoderma citrinoviride]